MPLVEVKDRFLRDESKQAEFEMFLSAQSCQQTEPGVIVYGVNIDFKDAIRVQFSKKGRIVSIRCHEGYANRLSDIIDGAIYVDHGKTIGRKIIFSKVQISNRFRLDDEYQIVPVPPDSPIPDTEVGDYPAILEFSYSKSPHHLVDLHRRSERETELSCMLSAFIRNGIKWINNRVDKHWVVDSSEGGSFAVSYCQEFYSCGDWENKDGIGFSIVDDIDDIQFMDPSEYFGQLAIMPRGLFLLPRPIREYFHKYESLSPADKAMARLSAYWLQKSNVVQSASISLSFSAIVFAIESLIPRAEQVGKCDKCEQAIYEKSVSEGFRDLINAHASGVPKRMVDDIYALRSTIAHGSGLMKHDQNVGFRFSDPLIKSDALFTQARHVAQIVFINWLMSRAT